MTARHTTHATAPRINGEAKLLLPPAVAVLVPVDSVTETSVDLATMRTYCPGAQPFALMRNGTVVRLWDSQPRAESCDRRVEEPVAAAALTVVKATSFMTVWSGRARDKAGGRSMVTEVAERRVEVPDAQAHTGPKGGR